MINFITYLVLAIVMAVLGGIIGAKIDIWYENAKTAKNRKKNCKVWIHREDLDYKDQNGISHRFYMCPKCGLVHDFVDGHTGQYKYCPQCGLFLGFNERRRK